MTKFRVYFDWNPSLTSFIHNYQPSSTYEDLHPYAVILVIKSFYKRPHSYVAVSKPTCLSQIAYRNNSAIAFSFYFFFSPFQERNAN